MTNTPQKAELITLAIDTSGAASVALVDGLGHVMAEQTELRARKHAELLGDFLPKVLSGNPAPSRVIVGVGPGPFTGLRAGIAAGIGFAVGCGIEVHGARSHDGLAQRAFDAGVCANVIIATDARRKEVYWSEYRITQERCELLNGPAVDTPADLAQRFDVSSLIRIGRGFELYPEILGAPTLLGTETQMGKWSEPLAGDIARAVQFSGTDAILPVAPLYLRAPDAKPLPGR